MPKSEHPFQKENIPRLLEQLLSFIFVAAYCALLAVFHRTQESALFFFLLSVSSFLISTLLRFFILTRRPAKEDGNKKSHSFPSRHTFSAFYIATVFFRIFPFVSYVFYALAVLLGVLRVVGRWHYPRDVVGGAFLGVLLGIITLLLL